MDDIKEKLDMLNSMQKLSDMQVLTNRVLYLEQTVELLQKQLDDLSNNLGHILSQQIRSDSTLREKIK